MLGRRAVATHDAVAAVVVWRGVLLTLGTLGSQPHSDQGHSFQVRIVEAEASPDDGLVLGKGLKDDDGKASAWAYTVCAPTFPPMSRRCTWLRGKPRPNKGDDENSTWLARDVECQGGRHGFWEMEDRPLVSSVSEKDIR